MYNIFIMNELVKTIADAMNNSLGAPLTVFLLAMIPIAEARFAIPFGISMGLSPLEAFGWAFLGTSLVTPILLLVLIPLIKALSKTKLFSKLGKFLFDKFEKKSRSLNENGSTTDANTEQTSKRPRLTKSDLKRMGGTAAFVAVPIPLTGVWTGSAVASIIKLSFVKGLVSVVIGNAVACSIITLICYLFAPYVDYITIGFAIIALLVVIALIVKLVLFKPSNTTDTTQSVSDTNGTHQLENSNSSPTVTTNGEHDDINTTESNGKNATADDNVTKINDDKSK